MFLVHSLSFPTRPFHTANFPFDYRDHLVLYAEYAQNREAKNRQSMKNFTHTGLYNNSTKKYRSLCIVCTDLTPLPN